MKNLQIQVLGVPQTGAKSRVETQIKLCLQLVTDKGEKVPLWSHLRLPEYMVAKEKLKTKNSRNGQDQGVNIAEKGVLNLEATVVCASETLKQVTTCLGCVQRERKRSQRKKENKLKSNPSAQLQEEASKVMDLDDEKSLALEQRKILLFNCSEIVDFSSGDTILPTRITCYCRHHNEKIGFCIIFVMKDCSGQVIARGVSPAIMITDDHKSSKTKQANGIARRRSRAEYDRRSVSHPKLADRTVERTVDRSPNSKASIPIPISSLPSNMFAQPECFGVGTTGKQKGPAIKNETQTNGIIQASDGSICGHQHQEIEEDIQLGLKVESERQNQQLQALNSYSTSPSTPLSPISPSSPPRSTSAPYHIPAKYDRSATLQSQGITNLYPLNLHQSMSLSPSAFQLSPSSTQLLQHHIQTGIAPQDIYGNAIFQTPNVGGYGPISRISRLIPSDGPIYGGVEVTVLGNNFYNGLTCVFGDTPAIPTQFWSSNTLVCLLPPSPTPGPVVVSFKEFPMNLMDHQNQEVVMFTYNDDSDRALMELALQVVGMKMTGKLEDARNIAMRIIGDSSTTSSHSPSASPSSNNHSMNSAILSIVRNASMSNSLEEHIIKTISLLDVETEFEDCISLQNNTKHTMLHLAAMLGFTSLCSMLLDREVNWEIQDSYGFTAFHYAAWTGRTEIVRLLLAAGARDDIRNVYDQRALDLATSRGYDEIVNLLFEQQHDSGVSLSPSSSEDTEDASFTESDDSWSVSDSEVEIENVEQGIKRETVDIVDDKDVSERRKSIEMTMRKEDTIHEDGKKELQITWVDPKAAAENNLSEENILGVDEIVDAEPVDDKKSKQPLTDLANDLASASTIWLQKTFAHLHMPNISKPTQLNIPLPNIKMPNLQMPNLQNFSSSKFTSPKFSTMTFTSKMSIPRPSMPSMPSLHMFEMPALPAMMAAFPAMISSSPFANFSREDKTAGSPQDPSIDQVKSVNNAWEHYLNFIRGQPGDKKEGGNMFGSNMFTYAWPLWYNSDEQQQQQQQQPHVPMYPHQPGEGPSAATPNTIKRPKRHVGHEYGIGSSDTDAIVRHKEKMNRLKKDRMLFLFWVPMLCVMVALAWFRFTSLPYLG